MIQYEKIDVSDVIDLKKSNKSKQYMICHYWHFLDIGYEYEQYVFNVCHDLSMMVYDLDNFIILNIKAGDYKCCLCKMSKNDAIKLLNNSALDNKDIF